MNERARACVRLRLRAFAPASAPAPVPAFIFIVRAFVVRSFAFAFAIACACVCVHLIARVPCAPRFTKNLSCSGVCKAWPVTLSLAHNLWAHNRFYAFLSNSYEADFMVMLVPMLVSPRLSIVFRFTWFMIGLLSLSDTVKPPTSDDIFFGGYLILSIICSALNSFSLGD